MSENQEIDKLSENYKALKKIGAQRIHEQTHIPKIQCEDLVEGHFETMNKVQFTGFISILEREYSLDLNALKEEGLSTFVKEEDVLNVDSKVFVTPKKTKSYTLYYIAAAIVVFIAVVIGMSSSEEQVEPKIDNKKIEQVTSKIAPQERLEVKEKVKQIIEEPKVVKEFKIVPKAKLWVGYIDLNTGKKLQKIISEEFALDPDGYWLLSLGHGHVDFTVNGEIKEFKNPKNIRLLYKDGELKKIGYQEFLSLNKGKEW